ncbi:MAG: DNA mismatch repair endonuclease MutL [Deltaproteobacteria bacterium]|nr:DNA mismatch repair endonuclease MutL [Deltaproteobacteria bacterium]
MMPYPETHRVVRLDPTLVSQIAAGEVIERPASVVRELLDNALDAGATQVEVDVEGGRDHRVEVRDDGRGIATADLKLTLARHATSKLRSIDDLFTLQTFGFRGEGLSSIAAVSRLVILTRAAGATAGQRLQAHGGEVKGVEPAARQVGTTVKVHDLFYNTPARRKFLKSTATEVAHVQDVVTRAALAAPTVRFILRVEGRKSFDLAPARSRLERVQALWGKTIVRHTARRGGGKAPSLTAEVFLAAVDESRGSARAIQFLVNQRPVRDRVLLQAVARGCGARLAARRYAQAVVFVECDPGFVDINVHPQKQEVRFADPTAVFSLVAEAVATALGEGTRPVSSSTAPRDSPTPRPFEQAQPLPAPARVYTLGRATSAPKSYPDHHKELEAATRRFWAAQHTRASEQNLDYGLGAALSRVRPLSDAHAPTRPRPTLLGCSSEGVLICELEGALLLVSKLAAMRELARRSLAGTFEDNPSARATPIAHALPRPFTFTPEDPSRWQRASEALARAGFELEAFGGGDWVLRAIPPQLPAEEPELRAILLEIEMSLAESDPESALLDVLAQSIIRLGAEMTAEELVERLGGTIAAQARLVTLESGRRDGPARAAKPGALSLCLDSTSLAALLEAGHG